MVDRGQPKEYEYRIGPVSAIRRHGFTIRVEIAGKALNALLDTGASSSVIDIRMARQLNLVEGRSRQVVGVTGGGRYPTFVADLAVPVLDFTLTGPLVGMPLRDNGLVFEAIVGRDVICRYEFTVNASTGVIRFTES